MKRVGNDFYIQRGENWTLDFEVANAAGDPLMLLKSWRNPYLVITVTSSLYTQEGALRENYWLELDKSWIEQDDGTQELLPVKRFISTEALPLPYNEDDVASAIKYYGIYADGRMVLDKNSQFDVTNYLFVCRDVDGNPIYKYVRDYTVEDGVVIDEQWELYNFRFVKQFCTEDWVEQDYTMDMKLLAGESLIEYVRRVLTEEMNYKGLPEDDNWTKVQTQRFIDMIQDNTKRASAKYVFNNNMPLMPSYEAKVVIQDNMHIFVSADTLGG